MIAKILINTSVKTLNKVYDYQVPEALEEQVEVGKRVEVSFGKSRQGLEEGIIVKLEEQVEDKGFKLKEIISVLDEDSYIDEFRLKLAKYMAYLYFCNVYDALKLMLPPGTKSKNSSKSLATKQDTRIRLVKSVDEIMQDIECERVSSPKQIQLLSFLIYNDYVLLPDVMEGLGISRSVIKTAEKNGYVLLEKVEVKPDFMKEYEIEKTEPKRLTKEQAIVLESIEQAIYEDRYQQNLIFGVTGSGKTEVYLQLIQKVLEKGKTAIVLVPEISLTYQTMTRFISRFGEKVAILHSKMTVAKRKEEYKRIKRGEVSIVVGARSAIFAPLDSIGLIIIDEEHDSSYYSQMTPKYSTKEIAAYICKEKQAVLVLGSATPEISTFYKAKTGKIELHEMKTRPGISTLPTIELIDMKEDRLLGNSSCFSMALKEEILKNIQRKEQTMLFLNRRGYSSYFTCKDCSFIFKCPNCDVAMTYHKKSNLLLCHYCSHVEKNMQCCPVCGSNNISDGSMGTQKIEEELKEIYPEITLLRMDADTTITRDSHQKILDQFKNENVNVLIGTQMISKGHDIANVTLVGILGADSLIAMNDFAASEKAFANISQVSGRAGRGDKEGRVIIQTSDTQNYILQAVKNQDYEEFFEQEIAFRKEFSYPPFTDIILFEIVGLNLSIVKAEAERLYQILNKEQKLYQVFSPKSPYIQKINNKYRVNVLMKTHLSSIVYKAIYQSVNEYSKHKKAGVTMTITKNPTFIN